jgi:hypothetical protein
MKCKKCDNPLCDTDRECISSPKKQYKKIPKGIPAEKVSAIKPALIETVNYFSELNKEHGGLRPSEVFVLDSVRTALREL